MFVITGNTFQTGGHWGGGEAIIVCSPGRSSAETRPITGQPTNWLQLDNGDTDLGGCGPVVITVNGATPSQAGACIGQRWQAYLLNRTISAALERRLRLRRWLLLFEDKRLPRIARGRAHILFFALPAALFPLTELLPQTRPR
jgi:hypothetical protein